MNIAITALVLSAISLSISLASFVWTIYKDTRYRAKIRLRLTRQRIDNFGPNPVLEILNDGPGAVTLDYYIFDIRPWYKRLFSQHSHRNLILSKGTLDKKLSAGETHRQLLNNWEFTQKSPHTLIGVSDKFRNAYFVPNRQLRAVTREALKEERKITGKKK